ncbi:hypothetical protein RCL_jg29261.t1 [Rhizophagus clarus]|uniref:Uncharacterized protein n=1 Tax=Rhizophagus clarus TaxID=94130 RepID=A0A8H3KQW7_9GLOM|nr:hypothetical protein RCL_jg29261.t1 [Rhizophagus clarus]
MSANRYTTNPLTGRTIRVGGSAFNQLVLEAYDYLDSGLVRRATAPPLPSVRGSYLNVSTGRMVQFGTRTYYNLIRMGDYEIIEDYYLVPPRYAEIAQSNPSLLYIQDTEVRLRYLETARNITVHHARWEQRNPSYRQGVEEARQFTRQREREARQFTRQREREAQREEQSRRLAELNIALCRECQMPVNLNELPESGLCEDCSKE